MAPTWVVPGLLIFLRKLEYTQFFKEHYLQIESQLVLNIRQYGAQKDMLLNFRQFEARGVLNFLKSEAFHYHMNSDTSDQNVGRSIRALYDFGWPFMILVRKNHIRISPYKNIKLTTNITQLTILVLLKLEVLMFLLM